MLAASTGTFSSRESSLTMPEERATVFHRGFRSCDPPVSQQEESRMHVGKRFGWLAVSGMLGLSLVAGVGPGARVVSAQAPRAAAADVPVYTKDIAPIIQRSCEKCHRADGVAPMSLSTYNE